MCVGMMVILPVGGSQPKQQRCFLVFVFWFCWSKELDVLRMMESIMVFVHHFFSP